MAGLTAKPGAPSTSLQRLYHVEKRIVHTVDLAGGVMEELAKQGGPRSDVVGAQCHEFMQAVKEIQMTLRDEIKSMCEYRPYENNDYAARTATEISVRKLDSVLGQLTDMQDIADEYHGIRPRSS
ncbi:hypothetical protein Mapa_011024 [Marchantia paleacea]|nr:hypothetical protein Mapa_011024 [Marchantia paleacea]